MIYKLFDESTSYDIMY